MTLKNVEKIEQETHEKTWFQKFKNKINSKLAPVAVASGALVASSAHAEGPAIPDFLGGATTSLGGIAVSLGALFLIAIAITLTIIAFTNSRGGIRRAG